MAASIIEAYPTVPSDLVAIAFDDFFHHPLSIEFHDEV
jgi:hypothetical protein